MNAIVVNSCYFSRIKLINPVTGEPIPGSERGYGFRGREVDYGLEPDYGTDCSFYSSEEEDIVFDSWFKAGKAFAWMSLMLGLIAFLILFFTCMCAYSGIMFERWLMWTYIFATVCLGLSFLAFGSEHCQENKCKVAPGSGYAISTFLFWLSCANTVKSMGGTMPPPRNNDNRKRRNPFRRNKNREQDQAEEDEWLNDMYYETEDQKYPLPETTPEGRKRYAHAEAYANDTEREFAEKYDNDYSSSEDEDDSEEEDDDDGSYYSGDEDDSDYDDDDDDNDNDENFRVNEKHKNKKQKHAAAQRTAPAGTEPQNHGPQPDFYEQELSEHNEGPAEGFSNEPEEELITLHQPAGQQQQQPDFDHQSDFLTGDNNTSAAKQQSQNDPFAAAAAAAAPHEDPFTTTAASPGAGYYDSQARVGDPDGPTLT